MVNLMRANERLREWIASSNYSQSDVAEILEVSRQAVSKWCNSTLTPSPRHGRELDKLSQGAIPATAWIRRTLPPPKSKGAKAIQKAATLYNGSILRLAIETELPQRALARWAANQNAPRKSQLVNINRALKTQLTVEDFAVSA